jgi:hypothetical protein
VIDSDLVFYDFLLFTRLLQVCNTFVKDHVLPKAHIYRGVLSLVNRGGICVQTMIRELGIAFVDEAFYPFKIFKLLLASRTTSSTALRMTMRLMASLFEIRILYRLKISDSRIPSLFTAHCLRNHWLEIIATLRYWTLRGKCDPLLPTDTL